MKILIIGLGSIGKQHIAALHQLGVELEIFALRSQEFAASYDGVTNIYQLSDTPRDVDFIIISNPTHLHLSTIQSVLVLNKPLFIEKPVLRYTEEIDQLGEVSVPTYVACQLRHHPCLQFVKENIVGRPIKDIQIYDGSYMPNWVQGRDWKEIFRADPILSGGVHLELIHEIDYCFWLFGEPLSVQSDLRKTGVLVPDLIDDARYDFSYTDFTAHIEVNYIDRTPRRTLDIVFADASYWHVDLLTFSVAENGKEIFSSTMTKSDLLASQMQYFLNCLASHTKPMNSVQEAAKVLTLALS